MNTSQRVAVVVPAVAIAALAFIAWQAYDVYHTTIVNLHLATKHIAIIEPAIRADTRFQKVILNTITRNRGSITIDGVVASDQALNDLRHLMDSSKSPVRVAWSVDVSADEPTPK